METPNELFHDSTEQNEILFVAEQNSTPQETDEPGQRSAPDWKGGGTVPQNRAEVIQTPTGGGRGTQNMAKVKFDPPKVPVIFVLGELACKFILFVFRCSEYYGVCKSVFLKK